MDEPSLITRLVHWLLRLLGLEPSTPPPPEPPPPGGSPEPVTRSVGLVIYNPTVPSQGGRRLSEVLGWNNPDALVDGLIADLKEISHGYANYFIAERIEIDAFPVKEDGFCYTADEFVQCWRTRRGFHQPDAVDYHHVLEDGQLVEKLNAGTIDEVWTVSFPYAGFYESRMAGPGAFWCNAPALEGTHAQRRFVIMGFNYERGVGEMLESFGHRAESIMAQVFRRTPDAGNLWKRFTLYDKIAPGQAEVGNVHFAPNSQADYDWGNPTPVLTRCRNWLNYPALSDESVTVDCREWGGGDIRAHHRWWFSLMPHINGKIMGISNNWWEYIVDPNHVR